MANFQETRNLGSNELTSDQVHMENKPKLLLHGADDHSIYMNFRNLRQAVQESVVILKNASESGLEEPSFIPIQRKNPVPDVPQSHLELVNDTQLCASIRNITQVETRRKHAFGMDISLIKFIKDAPTYAFQAGSEDAKDDHKYAPFNVSVMVLAKVVHRGTLDNTCKHSIEMDEIFYVYGRHYRSCRRIASVYTPCHEIHWRKDWKEFQQSRQWGKKIWALSSYSLNFFIHVRIIRGRKKAQTCQNIRLVNTWKLKSHKMTYKSVFLRMGSFHHPPAVCLSFFIYWQFSKSIP